jgi:hypothetical protein
MNRKESNTVCTVSSFGIIRPSTIHCYRIGSNQITLAIGGRSVQLELMLSGLQFATLHPPRHVWSMSGNAKSMIRKLTTHAHAAAGNLGNVVRDHMAISNAGPGASRLS